MLLLAMMLAATQDQVVTARQTTLSVEEVLGTKAKSSDIEREAAREVRRHNEKIEEELRKLRKGENRFSLPQKRQKATRTRTLPPNANSY